MKQLPILNGIFKAYAEEEKDIGDIQVLAHIAESAGLMSHQEVGFQSLFPPAFRQIPTGIFPTSQLTFFVFLCL